jgi:hypothetical protein
MALPRLQLIELEDSPWLPRFLRDMMTEYLRWVMDASGCYDPAAPMIAALLRRSGGRDVVDLASGGGGPWLRLLPMIDAELGTAVRVMLTDLHPNLDAVARAARQSRGAIRGHAEPVDATDVPVDLRGVRTMFTALHHLPPDAVHQVMRAASVAHEPFVAFELTTRSLLGVLTMVASLLLVLLSAPFVRPFRWERLVLTWLIPVLPVCIVWDGIVSACRSYTVPELRVFAAAVASDDYQWTVGRIEKWPARMALTYVIGQPVGEVALLHRR